MVLETAFASGSTERPSGELEETLAQLCYVLGQYDAIHRGGPMVRSPLHEAPFTVPPGLLSAADALSRLCPARVVADLGEMTNRFYGTQCNLLGAQRVELNPTFAGSVDVDGADGDLLVDGCLIDIKAAVDPAKIKPSWPWQLLGYVLLDYEDSSALTSVGLYLARQGQLVSWSLDDLRTMLGDTDHHPPLSDLRQEFRHAVTSLRADPW